MEANSFLFDSKYPFDRKQCTAYDLAKTNLNVADRSKIKLQWKQTFSQLQQILA